MAMVMLSLTWRAFSDNEDRHLGLSVLVLVCMSFYGSFWALGLFEIMMSPMMINITARYL